jgi:hypothetical protein
MGADERRASLRGIAEAIQLIKEAPDSEKKRRGNLFILMELDGILLDVNKSAQALEDAGNLTQAISLRDDWRWVADFWRDLKLDIDLKKDGFEALFAKYANKLPTFKRRMLKPETVFALVAVDEASEIDPAIKLGGISIVETPVSKVQTLENVEMVMLPKNVTVKVSCKNPIKRATNKIIDVKLFVLRGTKGRLVSVDKERDMAEVELILDNDLWPDAERLSDRVFIPLKDFRQPVKEVSRECKETRVQNEGVGSDRLGEFVESPSRSGAHAED